MPYILSYNTSIKPLEPDRILAEMWTFQRDLFRRITEHIRYAVFLCAAESSKGWRRWRYSNDTDIYEGKEDFTPGAFHVTADGHFHGGEFALQHCGQLFRGEAERGSHDGAGTGVSGAESHHIYCRRIRHRDQCLRGVLSGCGR